MLAFDLASNTAFWLIQSTPKFPLEGKYGFPKTGMPNAQTLLCISLADADVAQSIAKQMYAAQQPNVYLASKIPAALAGQPNDARVKLMQDQVASGNTPVHVVIPFKSRGGVKFMSIAKNRTWGLDFYNDLVGPTLNENLDLVYWELGPVAPGAGHGPTGIPLLTAALTAALTDWSQRFTAAPTFLPIGLWDAWSGMDVRAGSSFNMQFKRRTEP